MKTGIFWFRNDLRLHDNPALVKAAQDKQLLLVYILDTDPEQSHPIGSASKWWLHHALNALQAQLDSQLIVTQGDPKTILLELCERYSCDSVYWNRAYDPSSIKRDTDIKQSLKQANIDASSANGSLLWEPMQVLKKDGTPYKVFTPYYRKGCLAKEAPRYPVEKPRLKLLKHNENRDVESLNLLPKIPWDSEMRRLWDVSENGAKDKLEQFIKESLNGYDERRNLPAVKGTSHLSAYLRFGLISPNQAWYAVNDQFQQKGLSKAADTFLSELGWREFSYYLLFHFPHIQSKNFNAKFDNFPWLNDATALRKWQRGETGIPIVDAGMRELWKTGYMHNRVRMIVGSFLVKNLMIDWRNGERWFWDCLLDADHASNAASWQWVAGSGADAAPYFRIFNPILQGEKFDKQGEYVKRFCPELVNLPAKYIHKPWEAPSAILEQAQVKLGENYPQPIVDLKMSRQRALDAFASIK